MSNLIIWLIFVTLCAAAVWRITRTAPKGQVEILTKQLAVAEQSAHRSRQQLETAAARATHAEDQRDAAVRELATLRSCCLELADQWDAMAPAPGSYALAARELRQLITEKGAHR